MPAENKQELLRYLKYAIDAERELAVLKQIRAIIEKDFDDKKPSLRQIEMPQSGPASELRKPGLPLAPFFFAIIIVLFAIYVFVINVNISFSTAWKILCIIFMFSIIFSIDPITDYKRNKRKYYIWLLQRQEAARAYTDYQAKKRQAEIELNENLYHWNYHRNKILRSMDSIINDGMAVCRRLYQLDYIYPKYHHLAALTSIYEYFITGRCDSLAGPYGAYNIYEEEMRQDKIISQLNLIIENLDQIKTNQYMMYKEISKVKQSTDRVQAALARTNNYLIDIKQNQIVQANIMESKECFSEISVYCARN